MSDVLRVALVAEGVTDYVFLSAAVECMLGGRPFVFKLLQPEECAAFQGAGHAGPLGGGWKGVYKWCSQSRERGGGSLSGDIPLFVGYDLLVIHLDAEVAEETPNEPDFAGDLPCVRPCPPAAAATDELRAVLLKWIGEAATPPRTVLCTPSKTTEAWVVCACFPADREAVKPDFECFAKPENRLAQQPKTHRFAKARSDYEMHRDEFRAAWPQVAGKLSEALRFQEDFQRALPCPAEP